MLILSWNFYITAYIVLTLSYLWYRFALLFIAEVKESKRQVHAKYNDELISVIVPLYNENPKLVKRCVQSILDANGNKEVIVVDDGSKDVSCAKMIKENFRSKLLFIRYEKNKGKRFAQKVGFDRSKGKFIATVDCDTVITKNSLTNLVTPLISDDNVGATTGNIKVLNVKKNLLTKMIASRYWNAFNIERKSLSSFGIVTCCSGVLSAYRRDVISKFMNRYVNQKFLGEKCTYGDDRHLTNLVLMNGFKTKYAKNAVCYTQVPIGLWKFVKQQLRWKKSFIRESFIILKYSFNKNLLLFVETLFNILIPLWSLVIRLSIIVLMINYTNLIPLFVLSIILVAIIRNFFLFFENKYLAVHSIPYAFIHEFILYWLYFVALFTLRDKSWGTR